MAPNYKKEGFTGEKSIIIPRMVSEKRAANSISRQLYITDIGYYPRAKYHYRERNQGCDQYIFIYCTEGKGWYELKDKNYQVSPGEFFILPKNVKHRYGAKEKKPWTIYWAHFRGNLAEDFFNKFLEQGKYKSNIVEFLDERIELFYEVFDNLEMGYSKDNILYADICFYHFLASFLLPAQFSQVRKKEVLDTIDKSIHFMKENISEDLTLAQLAQNSSLSKSHYSRLFKEKTGWSPIAYFNHLKIQKACQLLDTSGNRIKEISINLGFRDQYYFSRLFKQIMGVSPKHYREKQRG